MSDDENNNGNGWLGDNEGNPSDISDESSAQEGSDFDSEHETDDQEAEYPSSPEMMFHMNGNSATNRFEQRRDRFLRMARDVLHIDTMLEFMMSAKINDEKELMRKYEDILVRMESAVSHYARKKHEARLNKKEQHKKFFQSNANIPYESDVSTPSLSEEEPHLLSEHEIRNLLPVPRIRYFQSIKMPYHVYLSE